jgi:predicted transcriptional regulator
MSKELVEGTVEDFVVRWGVDKTDAYHLLAGLASIGIVKKVGFKKTSTGKGKPTTIYGIPESVTFTATGTLDKVEKAVKKIKEKKVKDGEVVEDEPVVVNVNKLGVGDKVLDAQHLENGYGKVVITNEDLTTITFEESGETINIPTERVKKIHSEE